MLAHALATSLLGIVNDSVAFARSCPVGPVTRALGDVTSYCSWATSCCTLAVCFKPSAASCSLPSLSLDLLASSYASAYAYRRVLAQIGRQNPGPGPGKCCTAVKLLELFGNSVNRTSFEIKKNTANSRGQRHRDKQNMTTCRTMIATFFLQRTCNRLSFAAIAKLLFGKDEPNFN